jgi:hypothetical protein
MCLTYTINNIIVVSASKTITMNTMGKMRELQYTTEKVNNGHIYEGQRSGSEWM